MRLDGSPEPKRRIRLVADRSFQVTDDPVDALGIDGDEQRLLGRYVEVNRAGRDAGGFGNVADGRCVIAAVGKMHGRGIEKGRPSVRLLLCCSGGHIKPLR